MIKTSTIGVRQWLRRIKTNVEDVSIWQRFKRNVSISVLGSGMSMGIKLGQTALLTRLLKIEDYGRVLIVLNLFLFLDSFFGLRVNDLVFRFFPSLKEQKDARSLKGLLILCLGICLASGVMIYGGVVVLAPWLADRLYPNLGLAPLFNIYGCTILVSAFSGVYEPILRIHDRFTSIVLPQVLGSLATFALLCAYFATILLNGTYAQRGYSLKAIVAAFAVGALVASVPPLFQALRLVQPFLSGVTAKDGLQALAGYRRALVGCFANSNLSGYLRFAVSPGDTFLLGIFSSPTQLAWYGLAKQLTALPAILQGNIQTAMIPEITSLIASRKFAQLKRLLARYIWWTLALGSLLSISSLWLGRLLIWKVFRPEYLPSLPVFYVLTIAVWLMLVHIVFRPVAVSLDLLRWHNLALLVGAGLALVLIIVGKLNGLTMAFIQLADVLILRPLFGMLVWTRLKRLGEKSTDSA